MVTASQTVRFAVLIVKTEAGYAAAVPDLQGCAVSAPTVGHAQHAIRQAVERHMARLRKQGLPLPIPSSQIAYIEVVA